MHSMILPLPAAPVSHSLPSYGLQLSRLIAAWSRWRAQAFASRTATLLLARADSLDGTQPSYAADLREAARRVMEHSRHAATSGGSSAR